MKLNLKDSRTLILLGFAVIAVVTMSSIGVAGLLFTPNSYGQNFLLQLTERNEDAALEYLTPEFRDVVRNTCPESAVTECFWAQINNAWGDLAAMRFVRRDSSHTSELFHLTWSGLSAPLSVVLHTRLVDGSYLIDGWRGFVAGADEALDNALLEGLRDDGALLAASG